MSDKRLQNLQKIKSRISGLDNQINILKSNLVNYQDELQFSENELSKYSKNSTDYLINLQALYEYQLEVEHLQKKLHLYKKFKKTLENILYQQSSL